MRIFKDFIEAKSEIARELKEMGIKIENERMQDKLGSFPTVELINYSYTVVHPFLTDLEVTQPWVNAEWKERLAGIEGNPMNPGDAWQTRADAHMNWADYLEIQGKVKSVVTLEELARNKDPIRFTYSYGERFAIAQQVWQFIRELRRNPFTRQCWISIWDPNRDPHEVERGRRVPCSLGYHLMFREDKLHITYVMRSCDFVTHWQNDVFLALKLLLYIAKKAHVRLGNFTQTIFSFHVYEKDVKDVF